jgi:hypothetical protein
MTNDEANPNLPVLILLLLTRRAVAERRRMLVIDLPANHANYANFEGCALSPPINFNAQPAYAEASAWQALTCRAVAQRRRNVQRSMEDPSRNFVQKETK